MLFVRLKETKNMLEIHKEKISEEFQAMLIQMEDTKRAYKDVSLSESLKAKKRICVRVGDFDIDCIVMDEETQVNIMTEETWKFMGKPRMIPSLGRTGFFKGNR